VVHPKKETENCEIWRKRRKMEGSELYIEIEPEGLFSV